MQLDQSCFSWVQLIKKSDLPSNSKLLAFYLSTYMNSENSIAWPSQSKISSETGLTEPTVRKYLKVLEFDEWLIIKKRSRSVSSGAQNYAHNVYKINIPQRVISLLSDMSRGKTGDEQRVNSQLAEGKELTTNNNVNNNVNNNGESSDSLSFEKPLKAKIPTKEEVTKYFTDNGYTKESATKAYDYYEASREDGERVWRDSTGKTIKRWKQKMQGVWFKPENKENGSDNPVQSNHSDYVKRGRAVGVEDLGRATWSLDQFYAEVELKENNAHG